MMVLAYSAFGAVRKTVEVVARGQTGQTGQQVMKVGARVQAGKKRE
jgi:hypothetical protein